MIPLQNYYSMALPPKPFSLASTDQKIKLFKGWHARDILVATVISGMHLLCVYAPFTFSWSAFWLAIILHVITGMFGITLSYHRNLTHQSFKLPKCLEYLFAYFGLHALQGDPIFWVSTHRYHHKFTDTDQDPHSPLEGFWYSHFGWLVNYNHLLSKGETFMNVKDLERQSYYVFLQRSVVLHIYLLAALLYVFGGFPFIVWGMGVRTVITYHATFMVNSVCHIWGHQAWNTGDLSKNNWFVGVYSFGEGWHNNHHAFAFSARHGLEWWQIDTTWYVIKLLERVGLATDVKLPTETHKQKMSFKNGVNDMSFQQST
ncbi:hypothetical protein AQUCO_12400013v1 [Aquilegia coerulea]|uniref:Fatty acid desaturase domain-containing protein n=2 Tax=Aquilegia coerulea TaxID=218851 RepID=A0A2G5C1I6_AQUCA|nr:hypothetical protein AQUCO_12400013v1 [Aquilegia coerulea]